MCNNADVSLTGNNMNNTTHSQTHDDMLEEAFDTYIKEITQSGLPLWLADQYAHSIHLPVPSSISSSLSSSNEDRE